jgi:signal transduction histidine kinase
VLSLVKLNLNKLLLQKKKNVQEELTDTRELLSKAINDLRQISKSMNTSLIKQQKLSGLLKAETDTIERTGFFKTEFTIEGEEQEIESQKLLIIYRICQETINNIIKHSGARKISVFLIFDQDSFSLSIKDDGKGFDIDSLLKNKMNNKGIGIANMLNRARLIKANIHIDSHAGAGTVVNLKASYT